MVEGGEKLLSGEQSRNLIGRGRFEGGGEGVEERDWKSKGVDG